MRLNGPPSDAPVRVLHLPWNIGGHPAGLARAERAVGLNSLAIELEPGTLDLATDEVMSPTGTSAFERERARWRLLARALREADVVHYNWGDALFTPPPPSFHRGMQGPLKSRIAMSVAAEVRRLFPFHDLKKLREAGKVIAVTFQGDDARQGDQQSARHSRSLADVVEEGYYSPESDRWKRRRIAAFDRYADLIYALNPDLLHELPKRAKFLPYTSCDPFGVTPASTSNPRPLIVHAPTHRRVKGTDYVINALAALRNEGIDVDLDLVEDVPHAEALKRYARADIFIDQLIAGFYGGVAVEAMAMAKPVLCYLREDDRSLMPAEMRRALPIVNATPETLTSVLRELLAGGRETLSKLGAGSRAYVEAWHDPRAIARELQRDYEVALSSSKRRKY